MLAHGGLGEEGVERLVAVGHFRLEVLHVAVGVDGVLQTVELPAGVADLHPGLPHVDGDALTLREDRAGLAMSQSPQKEKEGFGAGGGGGGRGKVEEEEAQENRFLTKESGVFNRNNECI